MQPDKRENVQNFRILIVEHFVEQLCLSGKNINQSKKNIFCFL